MRFGWMVAAAAMAMSWAMPASAATVVQAMGDESPFGFQRFDARLGTLTDVLLNVTSSRNYDWQLRGTDTTTRFDYSYTINAPYAVNVGNLRLIAPLTGSGSGTVAADAFYPGFNNYATVALKSSTNTNFTLDTASFVGADRFFINGTDGGYTTGTGITVTSPQADLTRPYLGSCGGFSRTEEGCGVTLFTLTYTYVAATAPVPEPSSWLLMIAGFAAAGCVLRRRPHVSGSSAHDQPFRAYRPA